MNSIIFIIVLTILIIISIKIDKYLEKKNTTKGKIILRNYTIIIFALIPFIGGAICLIVFFTDLEHYSNMNIFNTPAVMSIPFFIISIILFMLNRRTLIKEKDHFTYKNVFGKTIEFDVTDIKSCECKYSMFRGNTDTLDRDKEIVIKLKNGKTIVIEDSMINYGKLYTYLSNKKFDE